ncbi:MAG: diphthamide biosynthesis enzyme Dph2 [Thermoplasmata archaeon]
MGSAHSISFEAADKALRRIRPKTVILQLPSGLKRRAIELADEIRRRYGCRVLISGDSCYGACDIVPGSFKADAIIQLGHAPMRMPRSDVPVIFVPILMDIDLEKMIATALPELKPPVGVIATAQHIHQIEKAVKILKSSGIKALVGKGDSRLSAPGQILGCDYSSARKIAGRVSSFLLLGGGEFHALGARLATGKPVIALDPEKNHASSEKVDSDAFLRRRFAIVQALADATTIGILVSSKLGQRRPKLAEEMLRKSREKKKRSEIIVIDDVTPAKLEDLGFEAYVSTACPRIALDDSGNYSRPLGTPAEFMIALGEMDWGDYVIDDRSFASRKTARRR